MVVYTSYRKMRKPRLFQLRFDFARRESRKQRVVKIALQHRRLTRGVTFDQGRGPRAVCGTQQIGYEDARRRLAQASHRAPQNLRVVQVVQQAVGYDDVTSTRRQRRLRKHRLDEQHALLEVLARDPPARVAQHFACTINRDDPRPSVQFRQPHRNVGVAATEIDGVERAFHFGQPALETLHDRSVRPFKVGAGVGARLLSVLHQFRFDDSVHGGRIAGVRLQASEGEREKDKNAAI